MNRVNKSNSIYKYCSEEIAELILLSNSVRLNTPESFNDPYDTNVIFSERDMSLVKDALLNYHLDQNFKLVIKEHFSEFKKYQKVIGFFAKLTIKLNDKTNERSKEYRPAMNYSRMIRFFNNLGLKNGQPGSSSQNALDKYIEIYKSKDINNSMTKELKTSTQNFLISCFSKNYSSELMWAHYANKNKGVCIEFENEGFMDVQYSTNRKPLTLEKVIGKILWNYHTSTQNFDEYKNDKTFLITLAPLLTKSLDWSYEEEVRCIVKSDNSKIIKEDNMFLYCFPYVKSITLGCRINSSIEKKLLGICNDKGISVYKMILSDTTFDLKRVKVSEKI